MSGGHFNYKCFKISEFADELKHEIDVNDFQSTDQYGDKVGSNFNPKTLNRIKVAHEIIETAAKLAKEIEWLYSGDHGEDSFNEIFDKIMKGK